MTIGDQIVAAPPHVMRSRLTYYVHRIFCPVDHTERYERRVAHATCRDPLEWVYRKITRIEQNTEGVSDGVQRLLEQALSDVDVIYARDGRRQVASGETLLLNLAELLDSVRLDDPEICEPNGWTDRVKPRSRPFLEAVDRRVGLTGEFVVGTRRAARKRQQLDSWSLRIGNGWRLHVTVGLADEPDADGRRDLETALSWGVIKWGKGEDAPSALSLVQLVDWPGSRVRTIDDSKAVDFGGTHVLRYKALQPHELRQRKLDQLVKEIVMDLKDLQTQLRPPNDLADLTNMDQSDIAEIKALLNEKRQLIFEGPPGSGKTYVAKLFARHFTGNPLDGEADERVTIVQFHQSYGYEDFIEGIRPETRDGQVVYEVRPGIFKQVCENARNDASGRPFVIIIDEINRGNLSRIFGELLLALEYRKDNTEVKLPYSGDEFTIPENVYLIGTMNTTDRSLALIDYALRRRFYFYRLMPVEGRQAKFLDSWLDKQPGLAEQRNRILRLFIALNQKVPQELEEHFQVGHSYFMQLNNGSDTELDRLWKHAIMPLLEEYFHSRPNRTEFLAQFAWRTLLKPAQVPAEPTTAPEDAPDEVGDGES